MMPTPTRESARQRRELLEINRLITSSLDPTVVLATVTRQAATLLRAEAAALWLENEDGVLEVAAAHRVPPGSAALDVPLGPGVMTRIRELGRDAGLDACVPVPLVLYGETLGVLAAYRRGGPRVTPEDEELLSALADQAAVALHNARIHRRLETQAEALRDSETRFRLGFEDAPIGMALVDRDGRFLRVNNILCELTGYTSAELSALTFQAITHPEDRDADLSLFRRLERGEIPRYQLEKRYVRKDATVIDIRLSVSAAHAVDGTPLYYIAQIEDVTESKKAHEALRRSEVQFRGLIERLPDGVFIHRHGPLAYVNRALCDLLGYDEPAALAGKSLADLHHPDDMPVLLERLATLDRGLPAPPREVRMIRRDGSVCDVETTAMLAQFEERPAVVVIVRDLAERRAAEREREEANHRLRAIVDLAPVGIAISDDGRRWDLNLHAQQLFARPPAAALDLAQLIDDIVATNDRPLPLPQWPGQRALAGEQVAPVELRLRRPDGGVIPILVSAAPIPGGASSPPGAVVALADISALKDLERLRAEWSALIAHDLRQPLTSIGLYAQLVAEQTASDPAVQRRAMHIRALAHRLGRMVQDLVDFTRLETRQLTLHRQRIELARVVEDAAERIAMETHDRPIELTIHAPAAPVDVDVDRLAQVMDNLLTNAVKYGDAGTPIVIDLDVTGDEAVVAVTNEGPGIEPDDLPYLFVRFQRARDVSRRGVKGIGLGLHITRELVEAHHGHITVKSVPGGLTTFRFTVPLATPAWHSTEARPQGP